MNSAFEAFGSYRKFVHFEMLHFVFRQHLFDSRKYFDVEAVGWFVSFAAIKAVHEYLDEAFVRKKVNKTGILETASTGSFSVMKNSLN